MPGCFVYGCKTGSHGSTGHFFRVPHVNGKRTPDPELKLAWTLKLKKVRSDVTFDPDNKNHRICSKHFIECDIIKEDSVTINGQVASSPRSRWMLADTAVPRIFDSVPSHLIKKSPKKRRNPEDRQIASKKKKICKVYEQIEEKRIAVEAEDNELPGNLIQFQYQDILQHFKADNDWEFRLHNSGKTLSFLRLELRNGIHVCKEVQVRVQTSGLVLENIPAAGL